MKKTIACLFLLITFLSVKANEGMWMLPYLSPGNRGYMEGIGYQSNEVIVFDEANPSIKDAVVIFGGGCTGVTVSDNGLIFTNHHCGYDAIQSQSSVENDYLRDGFVAHTQAEELPIPDLSVYYLLYTENITDLILSPVDSITNEQQREEKISALISQMKDSVKNDRPHIWVHIASYFSGNEYYLNVYRQFDDVRMVFAPPSSVGKFGGDTDNWMWPRHTGDFSAFRVYADKENNPAAYSEENVPYKPAYFVPVSLKGYREYDYCMTIGFPGSTSRYQTSWGIHQRVHSSNAPRIEARGIKQAIWQEAMSESDEIRIKYATKFVRSSNYWKNSIGMNRGINRMRVMERKQKLEQEFTAWVEQDASRKEKYGKALALIQEGYTSSDDMQRDLTYLSETLVNGTEIVRLANTVMGYDIHQSPEKQQEYWNDRLAPLYKDYEPSLDQKVLAAMLKLARKRVSDDFMPHIYTEIDKKFKGDYDKYAAYVFEKSIVPYPDKVKEVMKNPGKVKKLDKDPAYQLAHSVREAFDAAIVGVNLYRYDIKEGERLFFAGLQEMYPDKDFYPDANFTMRLSYGFIAGYHPFDGAWYDYATTEEGIFEKYRYNDPEFHVQPEILQLFENKDFGRYAGKGGHLNLCFISNNDITGGNSGSPMLDRYGRLIGLAFDGNWEAMSGDIVFEPEVQKAIGVDIRYVLFMIDKWGKCNRILEELEIIDEEE